MLTPLVQIGSPGIHMSIVFEAYSGPMVGSAPAPNLPRMSPMPTDFRNSDGGHMIGDTGCHLRGDDVDHGRALGVPTEYHPGVGTVRRHGLDMSARVIGTGGDGTTEIVGGGVVDRKYADAPPPYSRTQRIDKRLSDPPDARGLGGASGEHHIDVGAGSRGSG